jgi:hypothetical protein
MTHVGIVDYGHEIGARGRQERHDEVMNECDECLSGNVWVEQTTIRLSAHP